MSQAGKKTAKAMKFRPSKQFPTDQGKPLGGARLLRSLPSTLNHQPSTISAFTLLELLIVIVIIGLLATIGLPAIRGMTKSNAIVAADRQLLDDIAYARRLAIANHTTVYMLFVPPWIANTTVNDTSLLPMMTNLYQGQYNTYALFSYRSVGDQPGQQSPRYLTSWRTLPNGVYIATNKFYSPYIVAPDGQPYAPAFSTNSFPIPIVTNTAPNMAMPYIAFNYLGQLVYNAPLTGIETPVIQKQGTKGLYFEYIPLAHGSIFYPRDASGNFTPGPADIVETPKGTNGAYYTAYSSANAANGLPLTGSDAGKIYNQIYIDPLTGKARVQRQEVQ
jgi:prepilin-type N-terminal cleavage/methylation domain-containing protein